MRILQLVLIIAIAAFLRFYQIGTLPPSLTWDEVAWGYNAYSLGIDGRDEFGRFLPLNYLESFGDFKPPLYAYLDILPVKLFGLTEFAVRFPSALFGTLTVLVTYFLVKAILKRRDVALISSLLLAISPWHLMLSRAAFEANVASFFLVTGVWLFLEAVQRKKWLLLLSVLSFVFAFYTFNTARIVGPMLLVILGMLYWRTLLSLRKVVLSAVIFGLVLLLPVFPFMLTPQATLRFQEVNIFSDAKVIEMSNQEIANDNHAWWSNILHNRRVEYGLSFISHYLDHFRFDFLFINGDGNPKFSTQSIGQMYLWELPFFLIGILFLFKKREGNWKIIPLWMLLAIIPSAMARETPHALRIEAALPTFQILVAYGIIAVFSLLKKYQVVKLFALCSVLVALYFVAYYLQDYYRHYARNYSNEWQYGYKDAITYVNEVSDQYPIVYLTSSFGRPYIYTAFYTHYDPKHFRQEVRAHREVLGFVNVLGFGKYYFEKTLIPQQHKRGALYIDVPKDVAAKANILKKFYFLNGELALVAYTI